MRLSRAGDQLVLEEGQLAPRYYRNKRIAKVIFSKDWIQVNFYREHLRNRFQNFKPICKNIEKLTQEWKIQNFYLILNQNTGRTKFSAVFRLFPMKFCIFLSFSFQLLYVDRSARTSPQPGYIIFWVT